MGIIKNQIPKVCAAHCADSTDFWGFQFNCAYLLRQMVTVMNGFKSTLIVLLIGTVIGSLGSCTSRVKNKVPFPDQPSSIAPSPVTALNTPTSQPFTSPSASLPPTATPAENTIAVTIYTVDTQCANFVPEQVQVPGDRSMEAAVGKVIEAQSSGDFNLTGYRVSRNADGIATVDFRLAPNSQRKFVSLSTCEQFALFGGLRETLTRNSQWQVKSVRFTERGKEIVL